MNKKFVYQVGNNKKKLYYDARPTKYQDKTNSVFWFSLQSLSETFLILRRNEQDMTEMCIGLHVKYRCYSALVLMKLEFSGQIFEKSSNTKFYENPPSGSRVIPYGRTDRWTDMTKLIVAFRNFANDP